MATIKDNQRDTPSDMAETVPQAPVDVHEQVTEQHQTGAFTDIGPSPVVDFASVEDTTYSADATQMDDLGSFLERPVEIHTWQWLEGTPFYDTFNPWHLFFNTSSVKKKLDNYAFLQCKLHIKAVLNASPFYYGMGLVSYCPLPDFADNSVSNVLISNLTSLDFIPRSQRPHFFVSPQTNSAGEMELPFFFHRNWLDVTDASELTNMGNIYINEIIPLKNANGVSGDTVNVTFYAWATDVKLCGPTVELSMQSGKFKKQSNVSAQNDEYGKGPVSSVASAVAGAAEKLIKVPVIGVYAKATSIGASAVSKIASLFGFTNVPNIENLAPMKNLQFHAMSTGTISKPFDKLTIDAKNELCIDPRTVGLAAGDEMSISYLCGKESFLSRSTWSSSDARGTILFGSLVTPNLFDIASVPNGKIFAATPMCQVSRCFGYWRGDIVFRFVLVCTQYHKGRLMVTWDPVGNMSANTGEINTNYTRILDVDTNGSYEVRIPFLQSRHWLSTGGITKTSVKNYFVKGETPPYGLPASAFHNGTITVSILNDLTSPVTTSDIYLVTFVRGCENLEFAYPNDIAANSSYFEPQSGKWKKLDCVSMDKSDDARPQNESLVFHGEEYHSVRPILRRMNYETSSYILGTWVNTDVFAQFRINFSKFPAYYGWDPTSPYQAVNSVPTYAYFCYNKVTPYHLLVPCYVGMRGSINRCYQLDAAGANREVNSIQVNDVSATMPISSGRLIPVQKHAFTTGAAAEYPMSVKQLGASTCSTGVSLANGHVQPSLEVAHPHFYPFRFASTAPRHQMIGMEDDDTRYHFSQIQFSVRPSTQPETENVGFDRYFGIGADFTTFFFLNVPIQFLYTNDPIP